MLQIFADLNLIFSVALCANSVALCVAILIYYTEIQRKNCSTEMVVQAYRQYIIILSPVQKIGLSAGMVSHGDGRVGVPEPDNDGVGDEISYPCSCVETETVIGGAFFHRDISIFIFFLMEHVYVRNKANFQEEGIIHEILDYERDLYIMDSEAVVVRIVDRSFFKGTPLDIPELCFPFPLPVYVAADVGTGGEADLVEARVGISVYLTGAHAGEETAFKRLGEGCE